MLAADHPERKAYVEIRTVEELMREMTADQEVQAAANTGDPWARSKWASQSKEASQADMAVDSGASGSSAAAPATASS